MESWSTSKIGQLERANIQTFVIFDTETTGLDDPVRIMELCFVAYSRREPMNRPDGSPPRMESVLNLCFNPQREMSEEAACLNGLNTDDLETWSTFDMQARLVAMFLESLPKPVCMIAHNGNKFHFPLLVAEMKLANVPLPGRILCADSLEAFKSAFPEEHSQFFSFELKELYRRKIGRKPKETNTGMGDCRALIKIIHSKASNINVDLHQWFMDNAVPLSSVLPRW